MARAGIYLTIGSSAVLAVCILVNCAFPQVVTEPKLVGSWIGGEDFGEFIYHKTELLGYYLKENPRGKIVARLCSKNRMSLALVSSAGFAFNFPWYAEIHSIPADKIYFSRSSKCGEKREQYWFVPEDAAFYYDEIISAKRVTVRRFMESYYDDPASEAADEKFDDDISMFIDEIKKNENAEAFIIKNLKLNKGKLKAALKELQNKQVNLARIHIVRKNNYHAYYPEFMTVTIDP